MHYILPPENVHCISFFWTAFLGAAFFTLSTEYSQLLKKSSFAFIQVFKLISINKKKNCNSKELEELYRIKKKNKQLSYIVATEE